MRYIYKCRIYMKKSELKALIREVIEETMTDSPQKVDKAALHREMLAAKKELDNLLSYVKYGQTLSGSYVKDWQKVAELRKNIQDLLASLKAPNQP